MGGGIFKVQILRLPVSSSLHMWYQRDQRHLLHLPVPFIVLYLQVAVVDVPSAAHHGLSNIYKYNSHNWGGQRMHQARALQRPSPAVHALHRPRWKPQARVLQPATYPPPSMPSITPRDRVKRDPSSGLLMPITPIGSRRPRARYEQRTPAPAQKKK